MIERKAPTRRSLREVELTAPIIPVTDTREQADATLSTSPPAGELVGDTDTGAGRIFGISSTRGEATLTDLAAISAAHRG